MQVIFDATLNRRVIYDQRLFLYTHINVLDISESNRVLTLDDVALQK